jgi:hypothetical protein
MDKRELNNQEMEKVAGGRGKDVWLYTIEEIEQSPIFEGLKRLIVRIRNNRDLSIPASMRELEDHLNTYAQSNGHYRFSRQLCQEFIQKYLPLV